MEMCACPNLSSLPPPAFGVSAEKVIQFCSSGVSAVIGNLFYAIFIFIFGIVGATFGAMNGVLIGLKTQSFIRSATIGPITGAAFFILVFKNTVALWHSDDCGIGFFHSLMVAAKRTFEEVVPSHSDTPCAKVLSGGSVEKIPKIKITAKNVLDNWGNRISCSVCLQDFQVGEMGRSLRPCRHMFHMRCIDEWLLVSRSCPLCRRAL